MRTDYARIAETYDQSAVRHRIDPEPALAALAASGLPIGALDVACGTGNWLRVQRDAFPAASFAGLDASPEMLARAREKLPTEVALVEGTADALPFGDAAFDLVASTFAYHHFPDLPRAIREMRRVLRPGGTLLLRNVCPEKMPGNWVFRFFPECVAIDARRVPSPERLYRTVAALGFRVESGGADQRPRSDARRRARRGAPARRE